MLTKILITRPIFLFGTLSKRKEFLNILTPELDNPKKTEIRNKETKDLLLTIIIIEKLVKIIKIIVNRILFI